MDGSESELGHCRQQSGVEEEEDELRDTASQLILRRERNVCGSVGCYCRSEGASGMFGDANETDVG